MRKNLMILLVVAFALVVAAGQASALSGTNADSVKVKVFAKQGGDWFKAVTKHTDEEGVLEVKWVLPGQYRVSVEEKDQETPQTLAGKFKMLAETGKKITKDTDVDVYVFVGGVKVLAATYQTDDSGWVELPAITPETVYEFDVRSDGSNSKKSGMPRIKVKTKVDDSDWFVSYYGRTDENMVLERDGVLPGKYKFKYKSGDADPAQPFTLHARLLTDEGKKIKEPTQVEIYIYPGIKTLAAVVMTDERGWVTLPGVMTGMKYRLKVKD